VCGIAGIVHFDGTPPGDGVIGGMCDAIRHRGPDDEGIVLLPQGQAAPGQPRAALGARRLSIIDLAGGHQPLANEDGSVWAAQNGEIYNFQELRAFLEREGHQFRTHTDTEVIVHAYEQWGGDFVRHLDGMFAIAVWDSRAERLVLARDRFGKKPLMYFRDEHRLLFASELQSFAAVPGLPRELDYDALGSYLSYMSIPAPATIYRHIRKIPPGHALIADRRSLRIDPYWQLPFTPKTRVSEGEAVEEIRRLLDDAVRKRLMSDVPLGAFLSGGIDSSAVVSTMARLAGGPVKTYSIGFTDREYDELPDARQVAEHCGTEHHEEIVEPSAVEILPALARHFGEPFSDSSAVPSWYVAQLTRKGVTVALSGDGGDEIFAGYNRHAANRVAEQWARIPAVVREPAFAVARGAAAAGLGGERFAKFARGALLRRDERYRMWAGVFTPEAVASISPMAGASDPVLAEFEQVVGFDAVDAMLAADARYYLPSDLLVKVDVTSMAHSLEVRSPLLDTALAEFVAPLPSALKLPGLHTKHLLKRAIADRVPPATLTKPKQGFAVPISRWLREDLRDFVADHLRHSQVAAAGLVEQRAVNALIDAHTGGAADHQHRVWSLLMLELWWRHCPHP
jgi:asparagine synthase (glutamine-hydrolysing)